MGSKRLDWIDIAKGIAMILVIVGHTVPNPSPLRHAIFSFHMPVFFILAGYTFRPKPWRELLSGSVSRLLVPYVVLALAWQVPTFLMSGVSLTSGTLVAGLKTLVFASGVDVPGLGVTAVGMAWFLAALFTSRLLFNALVRLFDRRGIGVVWQGVVCAAIAFCGLSVSRLMGVYLPLDLGSELLYCAADVGWLYGAPKGAGAEREQAPAVYWSRCRLACPWRAEWA